MARVPRVLAVASHPIQYHAPWFRGLAEVPGIDFSVLFVQQPGAKDQGRGFGVPFQWDIPLLGGYRHRFVPRLRGPLDLQGFFAARIVRPADLLRDLAPDVVLLTGWHVWPLVQVLVAARRLRIPVIMRGEANAMRPRGRLARTAHRWLLSHCAAFLPIGRSSRAFYEGYGIDDSRLFDAPYFIDNHRFRDAAREQAPRRDSLRAKWGIPVDAVCFGFAGKLEPKKRILDVLAALRAARESLPALHLLVVGTGEQRDDAQAYTRDHGLPVTFAGFLNQSEIPGAYLAMDVLVLPSDFGETWGLVVNEAMACGRPTIVSDRVGCGPDLVREGRTGAVFPFGDTAALARAMVALASDGDRLRVMGEAAQEMVFGHYDATHAVDGTVRAVRHVAGLA